LIVARSGDAATYCFGVGAAQKPMSCYVGLIRACHPQPALAVTGFTTALAVGSNRRWESVLVGSAVLAGQLAVGWSNDFIDRDRDRDNHRIDKPIVAGAVMPELVRNSAIVAAAACVPLSFLSGWRAGAVHTAAVSAAFAYNARLKSTVFSVVPYVAAFGALPAFVALGGGAPVRPSNSATLAAALMGAGAHFINTLPDLEGDASTGVRGLPHRLGRTRSTYAGAALLATATGVVARTNGAPLGTASRLLAISAITSVAGVVATATTHRERLAWSLSLATAASTVALYLTRHETLR